MLVIITTSLYAQNNSSYLNELNNHRAKVDKEFGDTVTSILPNEEVLNFKHLNYYTPNPKLNILANFKKAIGKEFNMRTSAGKNKAFRQYGILSFKIDGQDFTLPIYQNIKLMKNEKYKDYIFIPFKDHTNGNETYGGGRYIEAKIPKGDTYRLDFNYAFNPYCHYTSGYNCPYPPEANFLDIKIEAGEKKYKSEAH